jgi:hypothetical protein
VLNINCDIQDFSVFRVLLFSENNLKIAEIGNKIDKNRYNKIKLGPNINCDIQDIGVFRVLPFLGNTQKISENLK